MNSTEETGLSIETRMRAVEQAVIAMNNIAADLAVSQSRMPEAIERAMERAISKTITSEERMVTVWESAGKHLRKTAKTEAGGWLLGFMYRGAGWMVAFTVLASIMGWIPAFKVMSQVKP